MIITSLLFKQKFDLESGGKAIQLLGNLANEIGSNYLEDYLHRTLTSIDELFC